MMGIADRFMDDITKHASLVRSIAKAERLLNAVVYWLLLLILLSACNAKDADPPTGTSAPPSAAPTATITVQGAAAILFTTPPPVRTEESLTSANRNIPSVFVGIVNYEPVPATLSQTEL